MGRPSLGENATVRRSVRLTPKQWQLIEREAKRRGLSQSGLLRVALVAAGVLSNDDLEAAS